VRRAGFGRSRRRVFRFVIRHSVVGSCADCSTAAPPSLLQLSSLLPSTPLCSPLLPCTSLLHFALVVRQRRPPLRRRPLFSLRMCDVHSSLCPSMPPRTNRVCLTCPGSCAIHAQPPRCPLSPLNDTHARPRFFFPLDACTRRQRSSVPPLSFCFLLSSVPFHLSDKATACAHWLLDAWQRARLNCLRGWPGWLHCPSLVVPGGWRSPPPQGPPPPRPACCTAGVGAFPGCHWLTALVLLLRPRNSHFARRLVQKLGLITRPTMVTIHVDACAGACRVAGRGRMPCQVATSECSMR
jgi:hypothetical protein